MNNTWHFLREFESKELVKRFIKKKFDFNLNSSKAFEITSAFNQGREYFSSSLKADISVKPLLQYYGIVALSRGLILILNKDARENNITPSHGLRIKNWNDISKSGKLEDIILKSSKGTFSELINVTNNKTYLRAASSGINCRVQFDVPPEESEFTFKEISLCFPDLEQSVKSWLNMEIPSRILKKFKNTDGKFEIEIQGNNNSEVLAKIFPLKFFEGLEILESGPNCIVKFNAEQTPNISQKWVSAFQVIGDPCVIPPFENEIFLNDISTMFSASFILGTISRYYPSTWSNINKGISNDSVLPFAINLMDFLQDKFPKIIMDFINSPYEFENK